MMTRKDHIAIAKGIAAADLGAANLEAVVDSVAERIEPLSKGFDIELFRAYCYAPPAKADT